MSPKRERARGILSRKFWRRERKKERARRKIRQWKRKLISLEEIRII